VYSNIPFDQLTFLGLVVLDMDAPIKTGGLNESNTYLYPTVGGDVRIPTREGIVTLLIQVFGEQYWS
jgi:hypothetical protein